MNNKATDEDLNLARELIAACELVSIETDELSAKRVPAKTVSDGDAGGVAIDVQQRSDAESFGVRLQATVTFDGGEAVAGVAAEYALLNGATPSERTLRVFANEVAIMTIYPYLRESIATITAKVFGTPVHLPVIERGQIHADLDAAP